ncbi:replicative DNA helicase [Zavarzinella formosa]|uniref:replicative DNA helicase n=1 Tax=Zavarzinella formosa TaxID=360055 RepID=UPI00030C34E7|nr:replicative DNA helicase [Zavarzinella formosa]
MSADGPGPDKLPPQSRDAERSVIGSCLRENSVINDVLQYLKPDNFYFDAHQKIFQSIIDIYNEGHPVDLVILADRLKLVKHLEDVGGYQYLGELWDAAPTAANAEYYARIVRDKAITRNLIHASTEILRDAYDQVMPADELLGAAERKVLDIAEKGVTSSTATLKEALEEAYTRLDARMGRTDPNAISGLATGFIDLDQITAGLQNSELIILAARPSIGKTAFSLNIVRHIVVEEQQAVFFVSLEQSKIELAERLLSSQAKVDGQKLRKGHLNSDDISKLHAAGDVLRRAKLFIDDSPAQGMLRICAQARRLKLRHNIRLIVIDYLQLIEPENRRDPRQEQVAQISRRLKFLARELNIPVIALAQVNRASEDRQDHRPRLADLRESGSIEQDADTCFMLHRPGKFDGGVEDNIIEVIVAKQRNGPTGEVTLSYHKQIMRYENYAGQGTFGIE